MHKFSISLALAAWLFSTVVCADQELRRGSLLVATGDVFGPIFAESVILLLHYDEFGAMGLVVNRPLGTKPADALPGIQALAEYDGTLYWGGPVQQYALRALLRTDIVPGHALPVFSSVYLVPPTAELLARASSPERLRFYVGYAGWAAGQLDAEIARGSWQVLPASEQAVFAEKPGELWKKLSPPREYRAAAHSGLASRMP